MIDRWLLCLLAVTVGCSGVRPAPEGMDAGRLASCPDTPNCVSSQSTDARHAIEPLRYAGELSAARERLIEALKGMKRSRIVANEGDRLTAEFTSALFGFVDDVEFRFAPEAKIIHVRSASRVGHFDFGVNRRRVETIRSRFDELQRKGGG